MQEGGILGRFSFSLESKKHISFGRRGSRATCKKLLSSDLRESLKSQGFERSRWYVCIRVCWRAPCVSVPSPQARALGKVSRALGDRTPRALRKNELGSMAKPVFLPADVGSEWESASKGRFHGLRHTFAGGERSSGWCTSWPVWLVGREHFLGLDSWQQLTLSPEPSDMHQGAVPGRTWGRCAEELQDGCWSGCAWSRHTGHLVLVEIAMPMLGTNRFCVFSFIHESLL